MPFGKDVPENAFGNESMVGPESPDDTDSLKEGRLAGTFETDRGSAFDVFAARNSLMTHQEIP